MKYPRSLYASIVSLILASNVSNAQVFFEDEFLGSGLDPAKWNVSIQTSGNRWCSSTVSNHLSSPGSWLDVSVTPCNGVQGSSPYGLIQVTDGVATFSADNGPGAFPYVWRGLPSLPSPFPTNGDFALEIRMRYLVHRSHGTGLFAVDWSNSEPEGDNPPVPAGGMVFSVWANGGTVSTVSLFEATVDVGNPREFHTYRLERTGSQYSVLVDGNLLLGPTESTLRPSTLWLGNPVFTHWGIGDWTDFAVDYVRVESEQPVPVRPTTWGHVKVHHR